MSSFRSLLLACLALYLAACRPTAQVNLAPSPIPFPTVTPGQAAHGVLPTEIALPLDGSGLSSPATAIALANQPTATPHYGLCPAPQNPALAAVMPNSAGGIRDAISSFLSSGGTANRLADGLKSWGILGETGSVRADLDVTGDGVPEVLLTYNAPGEGGTLRVLGCASGAYLSLYETLTGGETPQVLWTGDMNADTRPDILFTSRLCSATAPDDCAYQSQLLTWQPEGGRFISLLGRNLSSLNIPTASDVDNDRVSEIIVKLTDDGNKTTGPLRTGVNIYDWNGAGYVLSIVQLDAPRFKIQVLQEADRALNRQEPESAADLYLLALNDGQLRYWYNDEPDILKSYTLYRLIITYAYIEDGRLLSAYQNAAQVFPDPATAPVYAAMLNAFWNSFQVTHNLHSACLDVQAIITSRPEALSLLNRYGSRSPTYTADDLCPF